MTGALVAGAWAVAGCVAVRAALRAGDRAVLVHATRRWCRVEPPRALALALADADVRWPAATVWPAWMATVVVVLAAALLAGGPALGLVGLTAGVGAPVLALAAGRGRAAAAVDAALPDLLDGVARSLRSGATVGGALVELAPTQPGRLGRDLGVVVAEAAGGLGLLDALDGWARRCPTPGVRLIVAALALSIDAGGAAARAVDGVAATLRANLAVAGEVRAQSSQARLSALVIAAAPLAFGALAAGTDGRTADFLLRSRFGSACLAGGLALDGVAAWWMHRITAAPA